MVQDDTFKKISMTAEKWLPIQQVKQDDLGEYLKGKKTAGYVLIGLEQASHSVSLDAYSSCFPDRVVLIVGNEKCGISCSIL